MVEQLVTLQRVPIDRIQTEQQTNDDRVSALSSLGTKLTTLKTAAAALNETSAFSGRTVTSSAASGGWAATSSAGGSVGAYEISVSQLASAARLVGAADVGSTLSASASVSGVTLATLRGATPVTAGVISVNGHQVTVSTADSLQDFFTAISSATGGDVVASYNPATDKVSLTSLSAAPITLGAANDTSNLLRVLKLANNGTATIQSSASVAALSTNAVLASAGLRSAVSNVDASGNGSFAINGTTISYNVNSDSLSGVLKAINTSGAGVTASYDGTNDRVVLTNNRPGNLGIKVSETGSGLLAALGLVSGATLQSGTDAQFTVNGGPVLTASGNTLEAADHGIAGLNVTVTSTGTQTLTVGNDTTSMRGKIDAFISAYNAVQSYIDDKTKITTANGKITKGVLSSMREVQEWSRDMRQLVFKSVSGLSQTITSLDSLGLGFSGIDTSAKVLDEAKLTKALAERPNEVEAFFQKSSTGLAVAFGALVDRITTANDADQTRLNASNTDLDRQIADLERRIAMQKQLLTDSFVAMESAQSKIQQQGSAISQAFFSSSK